MTDEYEGRDKICQTVGEGWDHVGGHDVSDGVEGYHDWVGGAAVRISVGVGDLISCYGRNRRRCVVG